jgi:hypothetical protein
VLGKVFAVWSRVVANSYRPEKHYMRGPGPKSREPLPERWLALIHSIDEYEKRGRATKAEGE